jgi:hypothetical protein
VSYLVILVAVAALGIARLVIMHRREQARLTTIDGFRSSLAAIEAQTDPRAMRAANGGGRGRQPSGSAATQQLDPARRAAAKRRIEARRKFRRAGATKAQRERVDPRRRATTDPRRQARTVPRRRATTDPSRQVRTDPRRRARMDRRRHEPADLREPARIDPRGHGRGDPRRRAHPDRRMAG